MTDNVRHLPPRVAVSGVRFDAAFVARDDGAVLIWIPLEPFARERRMIVYPTGALLLIDEECVQTGAKPSEICNALRWLANRGDKP